MTDSEFTTFCEKSSPALVSWLCRKGLQEADAKEVAQESFVKARDCVNRKENPLDLSLNLESWLQTTALNYAKKLWRRPKREVLVDDVFPEGAALPDPVWVSGSIGLRPDLIVEKSERWKMLTAALKELEEMDRQCIVLRYFEKMDYKKIGAALGINEGTARARTCRAHPKLRRLLDSELSG